LAADELLDRGLVADRVESESRIAVSQPPISTRARVTTSAGPVGRAGVCPALPLTYPDELVDLSGATATGFAVAEGDFLPPRAGMFVETPVRGSIQDGHRRPNEELLEHPVALLPD
jgi:hypothetical protein